MILEGEKGKRALGWDYFNVCIMKFSVPDFH